MTRALSRHFALDEYAVSDSFPRLVEPVPDQLVPVVEQHATTLLQPIRDYVDRPVHILSGYRSKALNQAVGGSATSQHRAGEAADITLPGQEHSLAVRLLFEALLGGRLEIPSGQVIYYPARTFIHVALPSLRFPEPTFQVHDPARGLRYRGVSSVAELSRLLDEPAEALANPEE